MSAPHPAHQWVDEHGNDWRADDGGIFRLRKDNEGHVWWEPLVEVEGGELIVAQELLLLGANQETWG